MVNRPSRDMELVRNSVKPADHGTTGIKKTEPVKIKRTHETYRFRACKCRGQLPAYGKRQVCRCRPLFFGKTGPSFYEIQIFQYGIMIKQGPAAVVGTSPAVKPVMGGGPGIGPVHIRIDIFQLFQKRLRGFRTAR